jgi:dephospho-CoA kinase
MKIIGITGGVGAGKTQVLSYIEQHYNCRVIRADEVAHSLYEIGQECYDDIIGIFGDGITDGNKRIDKYKMAKLIFDNSDLLGRVNQVVHPAVKKYVTVQIEKEKADGNYDFLFIEAALLIEENYDEYLDEIWYIYASEEVRRKRLKESRNYSDEKISEIMDKQLSDVEFRKHSKQVITNDGDLEETYREIDKIMGDRRI